MKGQQEGADDKPRPDVESLFDGNPMPRSTD